MSFQIKFSSLVRKNLACPSLWEGKLDDERKVKCHFRTGLLEVYLDDKLVLSTFNKDEWDMGGYLSDEDLKSLLEKNNMIITEDTK